MQQADVASISRQITTVQNFMNEFEKTENFRKSLILNILYLKESSTGSTGNLNTASLTASLYLHWLIKILHSYCSKVSLIQLGFMENLLTNL